MLDRVHTAARIAPLIGAVSCVSAQLPDAEIARRLDEHVLRSTLGTFRGGIIAAREGRIILAKGYGLADDTLRAVDERSLFDIGSISKQFTAAAVLKLEQSGKLSTSDTVAKFFPGAGGRSGVVTLDHLLTHTAGMSDRQAIGPLSFPDRDRAVERAMAAEQVSEPGSRFEYCNAGYIVLAAVVEVASGERFEEYVRREVFVPAGLKDTGFLDGVGLDASRTVAREMNTGGKSRHVPLFASAGGEPWAWGLRGAGGVLMTLGDLVTWDRALTADTVLGAAAREKFVRVEKGGYARGWFVEPSGAGLKVHHSGGTRGFRAQLARYTDRGVVIAVWSGQDGDPVGMEKSLASIVMPELAESVAAKLFVGRLALGEHGVADLENATEWSARAVGDERGTRVILELQHTADRSRVAEFVMSTGATTNLIAQLRGHRASPDEPRGTTVMLGTAAYPRTGSDVVIPDGVMWRLQRGYRGESENGTVVSDPRATLVLVDEDRSFWPVIVRMDGHAVSELASKLEGLVR